MARLPLANRFAGADKHVEAHASWKQAGYPRTPSEKSGVGFRTSKPLPVDGRQHIAEFPLRDQSRVVAKGEILVPPEQYIRCFPMQCLSSLPNRLQRANDFTLRSPDYFECA